MHACDTHVTPGVTPLCCLMCDVTISVLCVVLLLFLVCMCVPSVAVWVSQSVDNQLSFGPVTLSLLYGLCVYTYTHKHT